MKRYGIIIFLLCLCVSGCSEVEIPLAEPDIVIEGWIEEGRHPIVIVTTSVSATSKYQDWDVLYDCIVRWARVTVSDGDESVILTGKFSKTHFPPYVYTTSRIVGEAGKTYTLTVEYEDHVEHAVTTIPGRVPLEYIKVVETEDDAYKIVAGLKDDPETRDYYRFFTKVEGMDSTYVPSFLGLVDDALLDDRVNEIDVNSAFVANFGTVQRSPMAYLEDDVVHVRFSAMDEASFAYWSDYDDLTTLAANPFFPVHKKIRSNVSSGMGYWAGYGSSYYTVSIADSLALGRVWPAEPSR